MFRRNRSPPQPNSFLDSVLTGPTSFGTLRPVTANRNPPKSSSKNKADLAEGLHSLPISTHNPTHHHLNSDYYPFKDRIGARMRQEEASKDGLKSVRSDTEIGYGDAERKGDQESVSTEMSKQEMKVSLRQVRFGGEVDRDAMRRGKVRSPSILKNSKHVLPGSILSDRSRSCSVASRKSHKPEKEHSSINSVIKQRFRSIVHQLQRDYIQQTTSQGRTSSSPPPFSAATYGCQRNRVPSRFKYRDDIFPPVYSSLFGIKKSRPKIGEELRWMRLGELFGEAVLCEENGMQIFRADQGYGEDYLPGALNSVGSNRELLKKMFEGQGVNEFGIYLVKIFQESVWKYIIVDDFVPVRKGENGFEPAFLSVRVPQGRKTDIWPFLLQKAYANYYSTYQALSYGNMLDFACEVSGSPASKFILKPQSASERNSQEPVEAVLKKIQLGLQKENTIAIAEVAGGKGFAPLVFSEGQFVWYDPFCEFKSRKLSLLGVKDTFQAVHLISGFQHCSCSLVRQPRSGCKGVKAPWFEAESPFMRTFKVDEGGEFAVCLKQRDRRFYHFREGQGDYIWVRLLLLQKEYEGAGYRWIKGEYARRKAIDLVEWLDPGQYVILIEPEWGLKSRGEVRLQLQSRPGQGESNCVQLESEWRKGERGEDWERVVEEGCRDLAQRFGELNQINKFICSYNYMSESVGYIIENIVNERISGPVSVIRSIRGLKCSSEIRPVNPEFYQRRENALRLQEQIELQIAEGGHFTVVLKMRGGLDLKFFRTFDFGC